MKRRSALASLAGLGLVAAGCGREKAQEPGQKLEPPPEQELLNLIYWDTLAFDPGPVPPTPARLLNAMAASSDERYLPYLLDLIAIPNPLGRRAREILAEKLPDPGFAGPMAWFEGRGKLPASVDSQDYLAFKRALFTTLQPEIAAFLDPGAKKSISAQEILWGGVFVDGIPPLESPRQISPEQAREWINADDQVIGVAIGGDARAYPRRIIDWHEMVNDTVGGTPVSLAYCTLCGSAVLYDGRVGDTTYRFGTSGLLYRSNKLMYDRQTRNLWEQYTGEPVWGSLVGSGTRLRFLPVVHTSWGEWLEANPTTRVLDIVTGFQRNYGPGVAYAQYWSSPDLMFPAPDRSGPLAAKDIVYAVRLDGETVGYPITELVRAGFFQDRLGTTDILVLATPDGSGARAYDRRGIRFASFDARSGIASSEDGVSWRVTEDWLVASDGRRLPRVPGHNSFWFSIVNHTENGRLFRP